MPVRGYPFLVPGPSTRCHAGGLPPTTSRSIHQMSCQWGGLCTTSSRSIHQMSCHGSGGYPLLVPGPSTRCHTSGGGGGYPPVQSHIWLGAAPCLVPYQVGGLPPCPVPCQVGMLPPVRSHARWGRYPTVPCQVEGLPPIQSHVRWGRGGYPLAPWDGPPVNRQTENITYPHTPCVVYLPHPKALWIREGVGG